MTCSHIAVTVESTVVTSTEIFYLSLLSGFQWLALSLFLCRLAGQVRKYHMYCSFKYIRLDVIGKVENIFFHALVLA